MPRDRNNAALLMMGNHYGTLAAARYYGRAGIPVYLADSERVTQTHWSRFVTRSVRAPKVGDLDELFRWLLKFGVAHPGTFLYPCSDDLAWLLASRREELSAHFRMYQPPLATIVSLLDKRRLYEACGAVGLDYPETLFPETEASLQALVASVGIPTLIKPRTQMLLDSKLKGAIVNSRDLLVEQYRRFRAHNTYGASLLAHDPTIAWPMLQRYHAEAKVDTYSIAGFVDETGDVFLVRAARKIFQRPRQIGVGLCFVGDTVHDELKQKLLALCRRVGYFGAFEAEFVHVSDGRFLLIDFNPRFYGQLGFEVARDLPLPGLVYHAAQGLRGDALLRAVGNPQAVLPAAAHHYSNRWVIELVMLTQSISGRLGASERRALRGILHDPGSHYVDAVYEGMDPGPFVADVLLNAKFFARHPRDFVRKFFLDA